MTLWEQTWLGPHNMFKRYDYANIFYTERSKILCDDD